MNKQFIAVALAVPFLLIACSSQSEAKPSLTPTVGASSSPESRVGAHDSCAVLDQMQSSLSTAVSELVANPDLATAFEAEFDKQVVLLFDLISSLHGDMVKGQQLQADLDSAVLAKDAAVNTFNDARQANNAFSKALGMADAALSAGDAVGAAQEVLVDLSGQLHCSP